MKVTGQEKFDLDAKKSRLRGWFFFEMTLYEKIALPYTLKAKYLLNHPRRLSLDPKILTLIVNPLPNGYLILRGVSLAVDRWGGAGHEKAVRDHEVGVAAVDRSVNIGRGGLHVGLTE